MVAADADRVKTGGGNLGDTYNIRGHLNDILDLKDGNAILLVGVPFRHENWREGMGKVLSQVPNQNRQAIESEMAKVLSEDHMRFIEVPMPLDLARRYDKLVGHDVEIPFLLKGVERLTERRDESVVRK